LVTTFLDNTLLECHPNGLLSINAIVDSTGFLLIRNYRRLIFNTVVGLNNWSYRVYAYTFFMTDEYSPFSLSED